MFSPHQLRPRALLGLALNGAGRWLASYLAPYPALADEHRTGFVTSSLCLDYAHPQLRYNDSTWLTVTVRLTIDRAAQRLRVRATYTGDRTPAAELTGEFRVLTLTGDEGLTALPGALPAQLAARFQPDEVYLPNSRIVQTPSMGEEVIPPHDYTTTLSRSHCEVADQWSFIEMTELMTRARERIYIADPAPSAMVRMAGLAVVRQMNVVLMRPLFVFDECVISTSAARSSNGSGEVVFRHTLRRGSETATSMIAWELMSSVD